MKDKHLIQCYPCEFFDGKQCEPPIDDDDFRCPVQLQAEDEAAYYYYLEGEVEE